MHTKLLNSCTNDAKEGGVYVFDVKCNSLAKVYSQQCMGLARYCGYYVLASQSIGVATENVTHELRSGTPHSIVCLDHAFKVVSEACVQQLGMSDLHDLMIYGGKVWVIDTFGNRVVVFGIRSEMRERGHSRSHVGTLSLC